MLPKNSPTSLNSWKKLKELASEIKEKGRSDYGFENLPIDEYSVSLSNLLFDYSRNLINNEILQVLEELSKESGIVSSFKQTIKGEKINETEGRSVLHYALRNPGSYDFELDGINVKSGIEKENLKVEAFSKQFIDGQLKGASGKPLNTIINIGIGGSDLGPYMVTEALKKYKHAGVSTHFVSNVDPRHIEEVLARIDPEASLFIISSKTFTTQETMANANTAKGWLKERLKTDSDLSAHFLAVSTNHEAVQKFGISPDRIFGFWDWVGGRYSLWSSIGLSIACTIGYENYSLLLKGAANADQHFMDAPFRDNIPLLMALLGVWYHNFLGAESQAILPYSQDLHRFPSYLQQADMESNGKSVDRGGKKVNYTTGPIIWGESGTNGQHAFYQLIHQGTHLIPIDIILFARSIGTDQEQHHMLLANGLAQREAFWNGKKT